MKNFTKVGVIVGSVALLMGAYGAFAGAQVNVACVQSAIDKRENSLIAARQQYDADVVAAIAVRRDARKAAWDLDTVAKRNAAIDQAMNAFRKSHDQADAKFMSAVKVGSKQFGADMKACKAAPAANEASI
ncbi:MAG: hypothetical protein A3A33_01820 [Candidatus Yanofskybacteria bacterium RIFCSPLOWO2_01_FULL_49_25]|uniref:DUF5667 domain-containing protein n=1 Tax=Candidatus Yanofskybacteria bacterium RIFCSPLOWO2_01_FULL_49_25 TaxID=1802701 RepID=A0A1F8GUB1_9BACT|nr:MAG: hypothetical protein A3A33_01820 [Candidatus Yanofskybacteria bacterium RIFCSPLOWO2_01_FULL_49_25]